MLNAELYKVLNCLNVLFYAVDEAQANQWMRRRYILRAYYNGKKYRTALVNILVNHYVMNLACLYNKQQYKIKKIKQNILILFKGTWLNIRGRSYPVHL